MASERASVSREVAVETLYRVAEKGAYAAPVLSAELARRGADPRDAGLATEIVYGALRVLPELDAAVGAHLRRPADTLDGHARAALRVGAYQLLHLGRIPVHAAVGETVGVARRSRGKKIGGFVNAILRKVAAARPEAPEPPERVVLPPWLPPSLESSLGTERASAFTELRPLPPPIGLRVDLSRTTREAFGERLREARPEAEVTTGAVAPSAVLVRRAGDPTKLPGYEEGEFAIQEQGAQAVGYLAGAKAGERVLDACAGRGGKTALLAAEVGEEGELVAFDLHEAKLDRIAAELRRLRVALAGRVETAAVDLTVGTGGFEARFDRVLVDAPCTGLGTVHRRPEILLRLGPKDPARLAETQLAIARNAARLLAPGGVLVYAVCSPLREEGADVVSRLRAEMPELRAVDEAWPLASTPEDEDGLVRIGPWNGDCDAYQVARLFRA